MFQIFFAHFNSKFHDNKRVSTTPRVCLLCYIMLLGVYRHLIHEIILKVFNVVFLCLIHYML